MGVYKWENGHLSSVAGIGTKVPPKGTSTFVSFGLNGPSINAKTIAFRAYTNTGNTGIYAEQYGRLVKVLDDQSLINGQKSVDIGYSPNELSSDGTIAFFDALANGDFGIFAMKVIESQSLF